MAAEGRFPGFDVRDHADHWDQATAAVVLGRLRSPEPPRFFTVAEQAALHALFARLLDLGPHDDVPVTEMVDARLAEQQTDGWHYQDMPPDAEAFRRSLALLDQDAENDCGTVFSKRSTAQQIAQLQAIHDLGARRWHDLVAAHIWGLWTRYACTAYYSHPHAWNEMGFPGPAYPRGYAALGVGKREPFEVADSAPADNPARSVRPRGSNGYDGHDEARS